MQATDEARTNPLGVTWIRTLGAIFSLALLVATAAVSTNGAAVAAPGELSTSMVEMLDESDTSSPVTLSEVRDDLFGGDAPGYGKGVDVAVIDTGVSPVDGLTGDKVLHGPDLSMEGSSPEVAYLDTYGHGTHMAGIIAGNRSGHEGIAPSARIVSIKVAGHDGITTVPQVVAAIDWVIDHRNADGLNIRVLNLSLGQSGVTTHVGDVLSAAVERAWDAGIFVVVAAGNDGDSQQHLDSPAIDPYIMAVGAVDTTGGDDEGEADDEDRDERNVPGWSARGDGHRNPDLVAAGRSVASYRVPGSTADLAAPSARYGDDLFLGSGTSQSAAVTSGLGAVILGANPSMTPDQVKATILHGTFDLDEVSSTRQGHGHVDGNAAVSAGPVPATKTDAPHAADGADFVVPTGMTWSGGTWSGMTWSGATWSGMTWSGGTWSGMTWSGMTWSGATWSGMTWSGGTWSGATWSGATWSGATWSGMTWSGEGWS